jgi:type VI secretion system FHA domain protein
MIVLTVLSYNGERAQGLSAQFDELGGTIGRADNNQLVLPDPERTISRVHARVVYRAGRYAIVDNGSNPISLNGIPAGAGREHPLNPGDEVQIGGYVLAASAAGGTASDDPFADLFGGAATGLAAPTPMAPKPVARAPAPPAAAWPTAAAGATQAWTPAPAAPAAAATPGASAAWLSPPGPPRAAAPVPAPPRVSAPSPGHIPDDWDPFAPDVESSPAPAATGQDLLLDLPLGGGGSLDDLFGLGGGMPAGDPLGATPAAAQLQQPNMASSVDPLEALSRTATLMPMSRHDHASELNTPMLLPPRPPAQPPEPAALPQGAICSWDDPPRDGRVVTLPGVHLSDTTPPPRASALAGLAALAATATTQAPAPAAAYATKGMAAAPAAAAGQAHADALLTGLLNGLATPGLRLPALTPESMQLIGQLLRESMRGTVELLVARAALKREMRADMTMIVARENNPLKFSPTVEVALNHLLGTQSPGFMPPAPAVRDAFDDLRAHQLGVMAGMRAALEGVLQRFDPQQLESKLTRKASISSLIPGARKARLWELFQELFTQLQSEAQDDFDELFGKAFLRAYEDQLDRLQGEPGPR